MSLALKIKAQSLAAEARIIRHYEQQVELHRHMLRNYDSEAHRGDVPTDLGGMLYDHTWIRTKVTLPPEKEIFDIEHSRALFELQYHRRNTVGVEARKTNIARGYLKGLHYIAIETPAKDKAQREGSQRLVKIYYAKDIARMVVKYGGPKYHNVTEDTIRNWIEATAALKIAA